MTKWHRRNASSIQKRSRRPRALLASIAACITLTVTACGNPNHSGFLSPYRVGIPQGNYLTKVQLNQIHIGMTTEEVQNRLGVPLLKNQFRPDQWNYLFRYQFPNGHAEQRRVILYFSNGILENIEADALPQVEDSADPGLPGYQPSRGKAKEPEKPAQEAADDSASNQKSLSGALRDAEKSEDATPEKEDSPPLGPTNAPETLESNIAKPSP